MRDRYDYDDKELPEDSQERALLATFDTLPDTLPPASSNVGAGATVTTGRSRSPATSITRAQVSTWIPNSFALAVSV